MACWLPLPAEPCGLDSSGSETGLVGGSLGYLRDFAQGSTLPSAFVGTSGAARRGSLR